MKSFKMFFALSLLLATLNSCHKSEFYTTVDEIVLSQQETLSEENLADVDLMVDEALQLNAGQLKSVTIATTSYLTSCAVITLNNNVTPKVMTIDFGSSCTGKDGKIRSGKIVVTTESFTTFPSVRNKTFVGYQVDGKKIEGKIVKTILKDSEQSIRTATIEEDVTMTLPNNEGTAHRTSVITRRYEYNMPATITDNQVVSWGSVVFTRTSGIKVTKTISAEKPLVFKISCHHIVSGIVTVTTSSSRNWSINFGNGDCDNLATLTIDGKTKEITIR